MFGPVTKAHSYVVKSGDDHLRNYYLVEDPLWIVAILGCYALFVYKIAPTWMKNRPPMELKNTMTLYNTFQIFSNAALCIYGVRQLFRHEFNISCIKFDPSPDGLSTALVLYYYFLSKLADLLDTVFFVLRKKQNQVSFLHVYHHMSMVLCAHGFCKWQPGGHATWVPVLNSFVHCAMYTYYLVSLWDSDKTRINRWKKPLTELQMGHHLAIVLLMGIAFFHPTCEFYRLASGLIMAQAFFIMCLFLKFYGTVYILKKSPEKVD